MKNLKRFLAVILCLILIQSPVQIISQTVTVQAAAREELVQSSRTGKYYYYDENGKIVKNDWRTVKGYRYYLSRTGAAYAAEKLDGVNYNIVAKKIDGRYHGFDNRGRMVKGLRVSMTGKAYFFSTKTGGYAASTTKKYRTALKTDTNAATIRKLLGKPRKIVTTDSCYKPNGKGISLIYKYYVLELFRYNDTGKEIVTGIWPI